MYNNIVVDGFHLLYTYECKLKAIVEVTFNYERFNTIVIIKNRRRESLFMMARVGGPVKSTFKVICIWLYEYTIVGIKYFKTL